jgi:hypothetical protein
MSGGGGGGCGGGLSGSSVLLVNAVRATFNPSQAQASI